MKGLIRISCIGLAVFQMVTVVGCAQPVNTEQPTVMVAVTEEAATSAAPTTDPATATPLFPTHTAEPVPTISLATVSQLGLLTTISVSDMPVVAGALSPVAHQGATYDARSYIHLWDTDNGAMQRQIGPLDTSGFGLAYSPDGTMLASGGGAEVTFWDPATAQQIGTVQLQIFVSKIVWSSDSKMVAVLGDSSRRVPLIDARSGQVVDEISIPSRNVLWSAAFSPNGRTLAVGDYQGNVTVINLGNKSVIATLDVKRGEPWDMEFSPDGALLITCDEIGGLHAWDTSSWAASETMTKLDAHGPLAGCADGLFSHDGGVYFSAGLDKRLVAWNVATGEKIGEHVFNSSIWTASLNGDGTQLALAMDDGSFQVLGFNGTAIVPPAPTEEVAGIIEIEDVPVYPGITETVGYDALDVPRKCAGIIFRHFDVYYNVDYGANLTKEERKASPLNLEIANFFRQEYAKENWLSFDMLPPRGAVIEIVYWEEENRSYDAAAGDPPFTGSCYLVTVLIQPPGADLEIIADVK